MNKKSILVIGNCEKALYNSAWDIVDAATAEEAIERSLQQDFNVVVFSNELQDEEKKLRKILAFQNPGLIVIQYNNGELMADKINEGLEKQHMNNKPSFSFVDDALKNAVLPVIVQ